jgi:hypothetical protein
VEHFLEEGLSGSDVELLAARLPNQLRQLGVKVDSKPPCEPDYQIDEAGFEQSLQKRINYLKSEGINS